MARVITINPADFTESEWEELYYGAGTFVPPDAETRRAPTFTRTSDQIKDAVAAARAKRDKVASGHYGTNIRERTRWLADLESAIKILEGLL